MSAALAAIVVIAAITDLAWRKIPNALIVAGWVCGFGGALWLRGWRGLVDAGLGFGAAFGVYLVLYLLRAQKAGDLKLATVVGCFLGPMGWLMAFAFTAVSGGVLALGAAASKGRLVHTLRNTAVIVTELARLRAPYEKSAELDVRTEAGMRLPHGIAIAVGTLMAVWARG